jgi:hypothetical protein
LRVLLVGSFDRLPSWSNIWGKLSNKRFTSKLWTTFRGRPPLRDLGGGTWRKNLLLRAQSLCSRVPSPREIWGKVRWTTT